MKKIQLTEGFMKNPLIRQFFGENTTYKIRWCTLFSRELKEKNADPTAMDFYLKKSAQKALVVMKGLPGLQNNFRVGHKHIGFISFDACTCVKEEDEDKEGPNTPLHFGDTLYILNTTTAVYISGYSEDDLEHGVSVVYEFKKRKKPKSKKKR